MSCMEPASSTESWTQASVAPRSTPMWRDRARAPARARQVLGASELLFTTLHRFTPTNTARVIALEGRLGPETLRAALATLQRRHPLLAVQVEAGPEPAFALAESAPIALHVVAREDDDHFARVLEQRLNTHVAHRPGPLLEVTYLHADGDARAELVIVCDHVICDGVGLNTLAGELLALCAGEPPAPPRPARPTLEQLLPRFSAFRRFAGFARTLARSLGMLVLRRLYEQRRAGRTTRFASTALSADETARLAARARAEGTTVTGALMAATLCAVAETRVTPPRLALSVPVNLRPHLAEHALEPQDLGNLTNVVYLEARRGSASWARARQLKEALTRAARRDRLLAGLALVYRTGRAFVRAQKPALAHVLVSNSGIVPLRASYGAFRAVAFYSGTSATMLSADFGFFCNTLGGSLRLNLVFLEEVVTPAEARAVLERVRALLSSQAEQPSS